MVFAYYFFKVYITVATLNPNEQILKIIKRWLSDWNIERADKNIMLPEG